MMDITIPHNNEEEFIAMAEALGYKELCFLYPTDNFFNLSEPKKQYLEKIKISKGVIADGKETNKIKNKLKADKAFVAVRSSNNRDREVIEGLKPDLIFSFENTARKDFIHQRASGINHILCKLAKEKEVMIGFSLSDILNAEDNKLILGRIIQNIQLCKKFKVKTLVASFAKSPFEMRSMHDITSLFQIFGLRNPEFLKEKDLN